ncbi:MAG: glycosyl hydrolase family 95 catalytic domain-containing protein [Prevotella sp.]
MPAHALRRRATTTDSLISRYALNQDDNLFLEELYFNYGRYLLISSSRGVALPANLQGIWNNRNQAAWHSDIHADINVQMNYWPAEPTNLSELHAAMTDWIYREAVVRTQWQANARSIGGVSKGWTLTTENNIYGSGSNWMSNYTIANAWLTSHLWQHFEYTQDTTFLRTKAFPVMKSCTDYWMEKLVKNTADGTYECPSEYSPEHGPNRENATAHSQQLVWDLFNSTLKAINKLGLANAGVDSAYIKKLQNRFDSLDNGCHTEVIDGTTYLREWKTTSQSTVRDWRSHRHISHLMGLYPLSQIGREQNDSIFRAAKNSLYARGLTGTGWSLGHKLNLMARAGDGENFHALIKNALRQTWQTTINMGNNGGVYENLWDAHSPFQIDGNFGYTSGVAEMLLQSRFGKLEILPALPARHWRSGSVKGLRAVGNFTVDITWQDTIATQLAVTSGSGLPCTVVYKDAKRFKVTTSTGGNVVVTVKGDNEISFPTTMNTLYYLDMNMAGDTTATRMRSSDFQVVNVSDEETSSEWAPAEHALDASATSFWHSRYNGAETAYPHVVTLRHLANGGISSVKLTNLREARYHAKFVTIEQSADGKTWETVASHKLLNRADSNVVRFDKMAALPFLRLTFEQGYNGSRLMTLNDIQFYGAVAQADSLYKLPLDYVATSDEETSRESSPARNAVDGNEATLWHSRYNSATAYPHSITLKNSTRDALKYIRLVQRPDNSAYSHTKYDAAEVIVYAGASEDMLSAVDTLRIPFYSTATVALKKPVTDKFVKLEFTRSQERSSNFLAIHEISGYANEMPFTMNPYGYATFFHNHAVTVPEGMEATTIKFENDRFRYDYEYHAGATIPANTGVMIKAAPGDYMFVYGGDDATAPTDN